MALSLGKPTEVCDFLTTVERSSEGLRHRLAMREGIDRCYYEGVQWIKNQSRRPDGSYGLGKLRDDYNPESRRLRVTANELSKFIQKVAASTAPDRIFCDVLPPERSNNIDDGLYADLCEVAVNTAIEQTKYLAVARLVNNRRAICGTYGMGLTVEAMGEDRRIRAFAFPAWKLLLDPHNESDDLEDHEYVGYQTEWTANRIERVFGASLKKMGKKLDRDQLRTLGDLNQAMGEINSLSGNRVYSGFRQQSQTKGARITQLHLRNDHGVFDRMFVILDIPDEEKVVINMDDPSTPFGGSGMPFIVLTGHFRSDTPWGISDVSMIRGYQDMLNLDQTLMRRMHQKMAGFQWVVDRRAFKHNATDSEIRQKFTNEPAGVIVYDGKESLQGVESPKMQTSPPPPPHLSESWDRHRALMRDNVHRAEGHFGQVKTHVTSSNFSRALDEADQVHGQRVKDDVAKHERLITVLHETSIRHVNDERPSAIVALRDAGFDASDFAAVISHQGTRVRVKVRESSIRYRSHEAKRQDIENAATNQYITPDEYMEAFARELDSPLTEIHRKMASEAMKAAMQILQGGEWEPEPVGRYAVFFLTAMREALFDRRAKENPEIRQRLRDAIRAQTLMTTREQMESDPALAAELLKEQQAESHGQENESLDTIDVAAIGRSLEPSAGTPALPA